MGHDMALTSAVRVERVRHPTPAVRDCEYRIHEVHAIAFSALGELIVNVYASLAGMPDVVEQPDYYLTFEEIESADRLQPTA